MATVEQEFDLALLSEAELARYPYPDRPLRLTVLGHREGEAGGADTVIEIRTTSQQLGLVFTKYRALRFSLAARARKWAVEDANEEAKGRLLQEADSLLPAAPDPVADVQLLVRLRRGLEGLGPVSEDSPTGEIDPWPGGKGRMAPFRPLGAHGRSGHAPQLGSAEALLGRTGGGRCSGRPSRRLKRAWPAHDPLRVGRRPVPHRGEQQ
ncbi:hypothetical protein [Streptomyces sp. YIM B13518]|uniref:hypothetical protein n=1 Tax=Streptomyces sp. YIM B13518 TaxID=3366316 RepID=UPI00367E0B41